MATTRGGRITGARDLRAHRRSLPSSGLLVDDSIGDVIDNNTTARKLPQPWYRARNSCLFLIAVPLGSWRQRGARRLPVTHRAGSTPDFGAPDPHAAPRKAP